LILANENRADEHSPWATIISKVPLIPQFEIVSVPEIISPIWPTDEYAINDFKSGWRKQIILVITAPVIEIAINGDDKDIILIGNILINRHTPYPPSLSKIAAKIILPAIGASTCALGNHKWSKNMGSFTKNPLINKMWKDLGIYMILYEMIIIGDW